MAEAAKAQEPLSSSTSSPLGVSQNSNGGPQQSKVEVSPVLTNLVPNQKTQNEPKQASEQVNSVADAKRRNRERMRRAFEKASPKGHDLWLQLHGDDDEYEAYLTEYLPPESQKHLPSSNRITKPVVSASSESPGVGTKADDDNGEECLNVRRGNSQRCNGENSKQPLRQAQTSASGYASIGSDVQKKFNLLKIEKPIDCIRPLPDFMKKSQDLPTSAVDLKEEKETNTNKSSCGSAASTSFNGSSSFNEMKQSVYTRRAQEKSLSNNGENTKPLSLEPAKDVKSTNIKAINESNKTTSDAANKKADLNNCSQQVLSQVSSGEGCSTSNDLTKADCQNSSIVSKRNQTSRRPRRQPMPRYQHPNIAKNKNVSDSKAPDSSLERHQNAGNLHQKIEDYSSAKESSILQKSLRTEPSQYASGEPKRSQTIRRQWRQPIPRYQCKPSLPTKSAEASKDCEVKKNTDANVTKSKNTYDELRSNSSFKKKESVSSGSDIATGHISTENENRRSNNTHTSTTVNNQNNLVDSKQNNPIKKVWQQPALRFPRKSPSQSTPPSATVQKKEANPNPSKSQNIIESKSSEKNESHIPDNNVDHHATSADLKRNQQFRRVWRQPIPRYQRKSSLPLDCTGSGSNLKTKNGANDQTVKNPNSSAMRGSSKKIESEAECNLQAPAKTFKEKEQSTSPNITKTNSLDSSTGSKQSKPFVRERRPSIPRYQSKTPSKTLRETNPANLKSVRGSNLHTTIRKSNCIVVSDDSLGKNKQNEQKNNCSSHEPIKVDVEQNTSTSLDVANLDHQIPSNKSKEAQLIHAVPKLPIIPALASSIPSMEVEKNVSHNILGGKETVANLSKPPSEIAEQNHNNSQKAPVLPSSNDESSALHDLPNADANEKRAKRRRKRPPRRNRYLKNLEHSTSANCDIHVDSVVATENNTKVNCEIPDSQLSKQRDETKSESVSEQIPQLAMENDKRTNSDENANFACVLENSTIETKKTISDQKIESPKENVENAFLYPIESDAKSIVPGANNDVAAKAKPKRKRRPRRKKVKQETGVEDPNLNKDILLNESAQDSDCPESNISGNLLEQNISNTEEQVMEQDVKPKEEMEKNSSPLVDAQSCQPIKDEKMPKQNPSDLSDPDSLITAADKIGETDDKISAPQLSEQIVINCLKLEANNVQQLSELCKESSAEGDKEISNNLPFSTDSTTEDPIGDQPIKKKRKQRRRPRRKKVSKTDNDDLQVACGHEKSTESATSENITAPHPGLDNESLCEKDKPDQTLVNATTNNDINGALSDLSSTDTSKNRVRSTDYATNVIDKRKMLENSSNNDINEIDDAPRSDSKPAESNLTEKDVEDADGDRPAKKKRRRRHRPLRKKLLNQDNDVKIECDTEQKSTMVFVNNGFCENVYNGFCENVSTPYPGLSSGMISNRDKHNQKLVETTTEMESKNTVTYDKVQKELQEHICKLSREKTTALLAKLKAEEKLDEVNIDKHLSNKDISLATERNEANLLGNIVGKDKVTVMVSNETKTATHSGEENPLRNFTDVCSRNSISPLSKLHAEKKFDEVSANQRAMQKIMYFLSAKQASSIEVVGSKITAQQPFEKSEQINAGFSTNVIRYVPAIEGDCGSDASNTKKTAESTSKVSCDSFAALLSKNEADKKSVEICSNNVITEKSKHMTTEKNVNNHSVNLSDEAETSGTSSLRKTAISNFKKKATAKCESPITHLRNVETTKNDKYSSSQETFKAENNSSRQVGIPNDEAILVVSKALASPSIQANTKDSQKGSSNTSCDIPYAQLSKLEREKKLADVSDERKTMLTQHKKKFSRIASCEIPVKQLPELEYKNVLSDLSKVVAENAEDCINNASCDTPDTQILEREVEKTLSGEPNEEASLVVSKALASSCENAKIIEDSQKSSSELSSDIVSAEEVLLNSKASDPLTNVFHVVNRPSVVDMPKHDDSAKDNANLQLCSGVAIHDFGNNKHIQEIKARKKLDEIEINHKSIEQSLNTSIEKNKNEPNSKICNNITCTCDYNNISSADQNNSSRGTVNSQHDHLIKSKEKHCCRPCFGNLVPPISAGPPTDCNSAPGPRQSKKTKLPEISTNEVSQHIYELQIAEQPKANLPNSPSSNDVFVDKLEKQMGSEKDQRDLEATFASGNDAKEKLSENNKIANSHGVEGVNDWPYKRKKKKPRRGKAKHIPSISAGHAPDSDSNSSNAADMLNNSLQQQSNQSFINNDCPSTSAQLVGSGKLEQFWQLQKSKIKDTFDLKGTNQNQTISCNETSLQYNDQVNKNEKLVSLDPLSIDTLNTSDCETASEQLQFQQHTKQNSTDVKEQHASPRSKSTNKIKIKTEYDNSLEPEKQIRNSRRKMLAVSNNEKKLTDSKKPLISIKENLESVELANKFIFAVNASEEGDAEKEKKSKRRRRHKKAKESHSEEEFKKAVDDVVAAAGERIDENLIQILREQKPMNDMEWEAIKRFYATDASKCSGETSDSEFHEVKRRKKARKKADQHQKSDTGELSLSEDEAHSISSKRSSTSNQTKRAVKASRRLSVTNHDNHVNEEPQLQKILETDEPTTMKGNKDVTQQLKCDVTFKEGIENLEGSTSFETACVYTEEQSEKKSMVHSFSSSDYKYHEAPEFNISETTVNSSRKPVNKKASGRVTNGVKINLKRPSHVPSLKSENPEPKFSSKGDKHSDLSHISTEIDFEPGRNAACKEAYSEAVHNNTVAEPHLLNNNSSNHQNLCSNKEIAYKEPDAPTFIDRSDGKTLQLTYSKATCDMSVIDFLGQTHHGDSPSNRMGKSKTNAKGLKSDTSVNKTDKVLNQLDHAPIHEPLVVGYVAADIGDRASQEKEVKAAIQPCSNAATKQSDKKLAGETGDSLTRQINSSRNKAVKSQCNSSINSSMITEELVTESSTSIFELPSLDTGEESFTLLGLYSSTYDTLVTTATQSVPCGNAAEDEESAESSSVTAASKKSNNVRQAINANSKTMESKKKKGKAENSFGKKMPPSHNRKSMQATSDQSKIEMEFPRAFGVRSENSENKQCEDKDNISKSTSCDTKSQNGKSRRKRKARSKESNSDISNNKSESSRGSFGNKMMKPKKRKQSEKKDPCRINEEIRSLEVNGITVTQPNEKKIEISLDTNQASKKKSNKYVFDEIVLALASDDEKLSLSKQERGKFLKNLNPAYRRQIALDTMKECSCYVLLPAIVILLLLSILFGFLFAYAFYGITPSATTTTTTIGQAPPITMRAPFIGRPLAPINAILHVIAQPSKGPYLQKYAGQWRKSLESVKWSQNVLSPALVEIYEDAGLSVDGVLITNLALFTNPQKRVSSRFYRRKPVVINHVIYPRSRKDGPLFLKDLIRRVRFALYKKKWIFDPKHFVLTQGNLTARAVTLQSFLSRDVPPLDLHSTDHDDSLQIHYNVTCPKLLVHDNVQVYPLNCKVNWNNPVNQTCRFSCENDYTLVGDEYTVCLANGVWSGQQAMCVKYCSALQPLKHGRIMPSYCTNENSTGQIPSYTRCIHYCDTNYRLFGVFQRKCREDGSWTYDNPICKRECPLLSQPMFGKISPSHCSTENPVEEDICTFSCLDGYLMEGSPTTSCNNAGRWTQEIPACRKTCNPLSSVPNANIHPSKCTQSVLFEGMSCSYICYDGFLLIGSKVRTCMSNESWTGKTPECIPSCRALEEIAHGNVIPTACTSTPQVAFSECRYACDTGYVLDGNENTTCQENGIWSTRQPECLAECPTIKVPKNGILHCNGSKQDSICVLHCMHSYQLHGTRIVTCHSNGVWSKPLGVCLGTCPKIKAPAHGIVTPKKCTLIDSTVNATCTFSCEKSYGIAGPISTRCMNTRSWTAAQATCLPESQYFLILEENKYQVCLTAKPGSYMPLKRNLKQCTGDSFDYWSLHKGSLIKNAGTGHCIGYDPPAEMAKLVFLKCNATDKRQIWKFHSDELSLKMRYFPYYIWYGYSSAQEVIATDQFSSLSNWMLFDPDRFLKFTFYGNVNDGKCPTLKRLSNGLWHPDSCWKYPSPDGTNCVFVCAPGYGRTNQTSVVACNLGVWKGIKKPFCVQSCRAFSSMKNAKITPIECSANEFVERGTTCTFICDKNYVLIGEKNIACLTSGHWSAPMPKCKRCCSPLTVPSNGKVIATEMCKKPNSMQMVNSICKISCNEGYVINGSNNVRCLKNGTWNDTDSTCVRACSKPQPPSLGVVVCNEERSLYPATTSCAYKCGAGRTLHPNVQSITCLSSGTWDNFSPSCQKFCPALLPIANGTVKPSICTEHNKILPNEFKCSFSCNLSYSLIGEKDLTCQETGEWNNAPPVCKLDTQFLLVHESNTVPLICVIAEGFSFYNKYHVSVVPFEKCNRWYSLHVWTLSPLNRIQNVGTGWCLSVSVAKEGEKLVLSKCGSAFHQQWESELKNQFVVIRLRHSDLYLRFQNNYVFISENYASAKDISWMTYDLSNVRGTLTGMNLGGKGTCPLLSLPYGTTTNSKNCLSPTAVGTTCIINCKSGYQLLSGNSSLDLHCDKFGVWSSLDIYCKPRQCSPLPPPTLNTVIDEEKCFTTSFPAFSEESCAYSCANGFYLDPPGGATGVLRCLGNGKWSEPIPKCFQYCRPLQVPKNTNVVPAKVCTMPNTAKYGQVCTFLCKAHFYLRGPQVLKCKSGKWNGSEPACIELSGAGKCKGFPSVNNAKLHPYFCHKSFAIVPQRTVCRIICRDGYSSVPNTYNQIVCQANGKWDLPLPTCRKVCPLFPVPLHSYLKPKSCKNGVITEGQTCSIVCQKGYALSSSGQVSCLSTGSWSSAQASCVPKPQFMIQNSNECAHAENDDQSWVYFQTCSLEDLSQWWEWIDNRRIMNVKTQTCLAPTVLDSYASGKLIDCNKVQHDWNCASSSSNQNGLIYNKRFFMAKAKSAPPSVLFVIDPKQDDSHWISQRITDLHAAGVDNLNVRACLFRPSSNCPPLPQIANGYVEKHCQSIAVVPGTICYHFCYEGYLLEGQAEKQCQISGEWTNDEKPQCKIACSPLQVPLFSRVTPESCKQEEQVEGTLCVFKCNEGFNLTGSSKRFCQPDGTWSGLPIICHQPCLAFKIPPMLSITPPTCATSNQEMGTVCTASCPFGYSLVGNSINVCRYDGKWSGTISNCKRSCEPLAKVDHGTILPFDCIKPGKYFGATCVVSCNALYGLQGSRVRTCAQDGLWSGSLAKCSRQCKTLSAPSNGYVECDKKLSLAGHSCRFFCNPNYVVAGSSSIRICQENGQWSGNKITCERESQFVLIQGSPNNPESCLTAAAENIVTIATNQFCKITNISVRWAWYKDHLIRHSATRLCLAGNILKVGSHLVLKECNKNDPDQIWECSDPVRSWFIRLAQRNLYPLHSPISIHYVLLLTEKGLDFLLNGSFAIHRHTQWYATTSSSARVSVCSVKQFDMCEPLKVYPPTIVSPALCSSQKISKGTNCYISCPSGYKLDRHIIVTECTIEGRWSHAVPRCIPACDSFSVQNQGALTINPPTCSGRYRHPENFVCRFSCPPNMQLVGNPVLTCQKNSKWNYPTPQCKITCPALNALKHAKVSPENCTVIGIRHIEGTQCRHECLQVDQVLSGPAVRTCKSNGFWDESAVRCVKPCPIVIPPDGGLVTPPECISQPSVADTVCTFTCVHNLIQKGPGFTICLPNGTWKGEKTRCQTVCSVLDIPQNGALKPSSCATTPTEFGQNCTLSCNSGYHVKGIKVVECLEDGNWSKPIGKCYRRCDKLLNPSNGYVEPKSCIGGNMYFGQECYFSCEYGFVLQGSPVRLCLSDGGWSGSEAVCAIGCPPIGPGLNIDFFPSDCSNQLQTSNAVCKAACKTGMQTRSGLLSSEVICNADGHWNETSIKACYPTCSTPVIANGRIECFLLDGTPTSIYTTSTICNVICDQNFFASSPTESKCDLIDGEENSNSSKWKPALANCQHEPDPMLIINRVQYEMVCLGVEHKRVVLVEWQQCRNSSYKTQWVWRNEFQIQNSATGYCMDVTHISSNAYVTTSYCDSSNIMQQWTCSNEDPYLVRLVSKPLYIDTAIKEIHGVVLRKEKLKFSKLYSYNPQGEDNYGTLCSRRSLHRKGDVCVLPKLPIPATFDHENCYPPNGIKVGSFCKVVCTNDITAIIECQPSGLWKPETKSLCKNTCRPYNSLKENAIILDSSCNANEIPFGTFCSLSCKKGFVLVGTTNGTNCTYGGLWTPTNNYTCVIGCPEIGPVENGILIPNKCITGVCNLVCFPRYRVSGPQSRTCMKNGQWSGTSFSCIADVQFSIVNSLKYKLHSLCLEAVSYTDVVKTKCAGSRNIQRWRWSSQFTIENVATKRCLAVTTSQVRNFDYSQRVDNIDNGTFINTDINNVIPIRLLNDGQKTVITKVCDAMDFTQRWNCGSEKESYLHLVGRKVYLDAGAPFRSNLDVSKTTSRKSIKWLGRFYGREKSVCAYRKAGTCKALHNLPNGLVIQELCKSDYILPGTRCTFACDDGYTIYGHENVICFDNGKWSALPPTCLGKTSCDSLQRDSHLLIEPSQCSSGLVLEGQVCNFECSSGTSIQGDSKLVCTADGSWSGIIPFCNMMCPAIHPPAQGSVIPKQCERGILGPSFSCASQCMANSTLINAVNHTCLVDGSWEGHQPVCGHFCPPLKKIRHGKISPEKCAMKISGSGEVCSVECKFGFFLSGKAKITCINGKWSVQPPDCKKNHCNRILPNRNTKSIVYSGLTNGAIVASSVVNISCNFGYETKISSTRVCLPSGAWTVESSICQPIRCPPLNKLYKGVVSPRNCTENINGVPVGIVCYFTCKTGFLLNGITSKECLLGGNWAYSSFTASCLDTLPKVQPAIFNIQVRKIVDSGNVQIKCLQSTSNDDGLDLVDCDYNNFFQRWNWFGTSLIKSIGSQLCVKLGKSLKAIKRFSLVEFLHQGLCVFNQSETLRCGDISSEAGSLQLNFGTTVLGSQIIGGSENLYLVFWSGKWIDYTKNKNYEMIPPTTPDQMPICSFMCGGIFVADEGDFSTPNYPLKYPKNIRCEWTIQTQTLSRELLMDISSMKFQPENYNLFIGEECLHDYVEVYEEREDGANFLRRFCVNTIPVRFNTLHGRFRLVFFSDNIEVGTGGTGWAAHWWSKPWSPPKTNCGRLNRNLPVVVSESEPTAAPWQVLVIFRERDLCNGVIFNSYFVIASASCIENFRNLSTLSEDQQVLIMYGFVSQADLIKRYQKEDFNAVRRIWIHPEYARSTFKNDLALVMTRKEIKFGFSVMPICLPSVVQPDIVIMGSAKCWGVQWSRDVFSHKHSSWDFTRYSYIRLLKKNECAEILQRHKNLKLRSNLICAKEAEDPETNLPLSPQPIASKHEDDEGSFLQCNWNKNWYLVGISSFTFNDDCDKPVYIYTKIRAYTQWISGTSTNSFYKLRDEYLNTFN